jgi:hypothetical protein
VAAYWRKHYDIVEYLNTNWKTIAADLQGKIHFVVRADDTFDLDGAAHSLESALNKLNGEPHFTSLQGDLTSASIWETMIVGHSSTKSQQRCTRSPVLRYALTVRIAALSRCRAFRDRPRASSPRAAVAHSTPTPANDAN